MTDRIRDSDLASLIAWAEVSNELVLRALLELKELRLLIKTISNWGCNGQCVELCGTKCPCCIAEEFLMR